MAVTIPLRRLLQMKGEYDQEFASQEEMSERTQECYRNLLRQIQAAADRNQGVLPGLEQQPQAPQGQGVLL